MLASPQRSAFVATTPKPASAKPPSSSTKCARRDWQRFRPQSVSLATRKPVATTWRKACCPKQKRSSAQRSRPTPTQPRHTQASPKSASVATTRATRAPKPIPHLRLRANAPALLVLARLDLTSNLLPASADEVSRALRLEPSNAAAQALRQTLQQRGQAVSVAAHAREHNARAPLFPPMLRSCCSRAASC